MAFSRITHDPAVLVGKPCIRGVRISVSTIVGLVASGVSQERDCFLGACMVTITIALAW
jgi:uncharacterized protein (DUF433 family)